MSFRFRLVFVVFFLTAVLIFAVYLRRARNHMLYKLYTVGIEQSQVEQRLSDNQLRLENLINPTAVSKFINNDIYLTAAEQ